MFKSPPTVSENPVNKLARWKGLSHKDYNLYFMRCPLCVKKIHHRSEYQETDFPEKPFGYWAKCLDLHLWYDHVVPWLTAVGIRPPKKGARWKYLERINSEREKALEALWADPQFPSRIKKKLSAEIAGLAYASEEVKRLARKIKTAPERPGKLTRIFVPEPGEVESLLREHPWAASRSYVAAKRASAEAKSRFQFRVAFIFRANAGYDFIPKTPSSLSAVSESVKELSGRIKRISDKAHLFFTERMESLKNPVKRYLLAWNTFHYYHLLERFPEETRALLEKKFKKSSAPLYISLFLSGVENPSELLAEVGYVVYINFLTALSIEGLREGRALKDIKLEEVIDVFPLPLKAVLSLLPEDWKSSVNVLEAVYLAINKGFVRRRK